MEMIVPMVETVRTIPLIIERGSKGIPIDTDTGFPFESDSNDDDSLRSHLDNIAKRHPEFAEHLVSFPTSPSTSRQQNRSNNTRDDPNLRTRFQRNIPGHSRDIGGANTHFQRFPFTFNRDDFFDNPQQYYQSEPPQQQQYYKSEPKQQYYQPEPQQQYYQSEPQQQYYQPEEEFNQAEQQQEPELNQEQRGKNLQQSNTVDLGQKQEPIDVNDRNQRSMSAPPQTDNKQRFVSSINIPINNNKMDSETQQQSSNSKPMERVIPIHVEGRDEPVLPRNQHFTTTNQPQAEKVFGGGGGGGGGFTQQPPSTERLFGHRPSQFTQFVPPRMHEEVFRQQPRTQTQQQAKAPPPQPQQQQQPKPQQSKPQQPQQPKSQPPPPKQQQQQQQQQQQDEPELVQPQQPKPSTTSPIDVIKLIQKDVSNLMAQVDQFVGQKNDKQYLYLDEMLTRNLIKLDNIDTQGQENIRQARKEAIKCIESCIGILETKAAGNKQQQQQLEIKEQTVQEQQPIPLPPSDVEDTQMEEEITSDQQEQAQKMDVEMKEEPEMINKIEVEVTGSKMNEVKESEKNEILPENVVVETENKIEEEEMKTDKAVVDDEKKEEDSSDKKEKKKVKRKFFRKSKD